MIQLFVIRDDELPMTPSEKVDSHHQTSESFVFSVNNVKIKGRLNSNYSQLRPYFVCTSFKGLEKF